MIIFRLPFQEKIYTTDKNPEKSFVGFYSFALDKNISFNGNLIEIQPQDLEEINSKLKDAPAIPLQESKEDYLLKIEKSIQNIQQRKLPKLVVARKKIIALSHLNIAETFLNLIKEYPSAFVYAFSHKDYFWMGAFSELLGKYDKSTKTFETMSLAGTLPKDEDWTEKEIEEQKPVSNYIHNILQKFSPSIEVSPTKNHFSGKIKHLRTDFKTTIEENELEKIIGELHPTPAVCGIPKEECQSFIRSLEGFDREFYAGYSKIELPDSIYYFVNLRCGKFYKNMVELFVGGGITALSNPENEWRETELKAEALTKNFIFNF